jgi:hypothetical protein
MVKLTFTIDEINFILAALSERPFKDVASLVMKIKEDAEKQLAAVASESVNTTVPEGASV